MSDSVGTSYVDIKGKVELLDQKFTHRIDTIVDKHLTLKADFDKLTASVVALSATVNNAVKYLLGGATVISFLMSGYGVKVLSILGGVNA
jgi:hypothetical protein